MMIFFNGNLVRDVKLMLDKVLNVLRLYLLLFWRYPENTGGGNIYPPPPPSLRWLRLSTRLSKARKNDVAGQDSTQNG